MGDIVKNLDCLKFGLMATVAAMRSALAQDAGAPPAAAPEVADVANGIAPPGAGATPKNIEAAKVQAKEAALTPIIPSPKDSTRPAFQLYAEIDIPVLTAGIVAASARLFRVQKAYCAPLCDPAELNALDRATAGTWNTTWATTSDFALYGLLGSAATILVIDEGPLDGLNDGVVVAESALSATAVASVFSLAAGRARPFVYGTDAPLADRNSGDAGLSFLSSHSSVAFAVVASMFMTTRRVNPNSKVPLLIALVGGAGATLVAVSRVTAGRHFVTDAAGGALIGTSMGVLVPALHGSPVKLIPVVSQTERGLSLAGTF
jgi:membrane-associated phospholipid phosphatase